MEALKTFVNRVIPPVYRFPEAPAQAEESIHTLILSVDDDVRPTERLLRLSHQAVQAAYRQVDLSDLAARPGVPQRLTCWPGESYRLIGGMMLALRPRMVVEVGTGRGLSTLVVRKYLNESSRCVTLDKRPWKQVPGTVLVDADFGADLEQRAPRTAEALNPAEHHDLLEQADLILFDLEDADSELAFRSLDLLRNSKAIVLVDGTRRWGNLKAWRDVRWPKLDMTSWGRWSGTGLIELGSAQPVSH